MAEEGMGSVLSGNVKTPLGEVKKSTALFAGSAVVILAVLYYRSQKQKSAASSAGSPEIDPATGYAFGSPEDAAALAAQANYTLPGGVGGGGGGGGSVGTGNPLNNAEWTNSVIQYWKDNDLGDPTLMSAALGVYLAGGVPTTAQVDLIHQAIAAKGLPPNAGSNGYPPAINTSSGTTPPPGGGGGTGPTNHPAFDLTVAAGSKVAAFTDAIRARDGFDPDWGGIIVPANPGIESNINWVKDINGRTFKKGATYHIPAITR